MTYIEETIVLVGLTLTDASDLFRRIVIEEPERVMSRHIVITATGLSPPRLEGRRVHDYAVSWSAGRGRNYFETMNVLKRAFIRDNPEGSKLPECP